MEVLIYIWFFLVLWIMLQRYLFHWWLWYSCLGWRSGIRKSKSRQDCSWRRRTIFEGIMFSSIYYSHRQVDASYLRKVDLQELNAIFSKPLKKILSTEVEVDDAALISIDSRGTDVRVRQGAQVHNIVLVFTLSNVLYLFFNIFSCA